jgi:hypothetical protein
MIHLDTWQSLTAVSRRAGHRVDMLRRLRVSQTAPRGYSHSSRQMPAVHRSEWMCPSS